MNEAPRGIHQSIRISRDLDKTRYSVHIHPRAAAAGETKTPVPLPIRAYKLILFVYWLALCGGLALGNLITLRLAIELSLILLNSAIEICRHNEAALVTLLTVH